VDCKKCVEGRFAHQFRKISEQKLDIAGAGEYTSSFFYGNGNEKPELGKVFCTQGNDTGVKMGKFVSDKMPYVLLRSRCCDIIVRTVNVPTVDKRGDMNEWFYEEPKHVFDKFSFFFNTSSRTFMACYLGP
jgi:hypothetical protein